MIDWEQQNVGTFETSTTCSLRDEHYVHEISGRRIHDSRMYEYYRRAHHCILSDDDGDIDVVYCQDVNNPGGNIPITVKFFFGTDPDGFTSLLVVLLERYTR